MLLSIIEDGLVADYLAWWDRFPAWDTGKRARLTFNPSQCHTRGWYGHTAERERSQCHNINDAIRESTWELCISPVVQHIGQPTLWYMRSNVRFELRGWSRDSCQTVFLNYRNHLLSLTLLHTIVVVCCWDRNCVTLKLLCCFFFLTRQRIDMDGEWEIVLWHGPGGEWEIKAWICKPENLVCVLILL